MNVLDLASQELAALASGSNELGMRTVAFCEIAPFARRVLAKHWPDVPCYDDVRSLTAERLAADGIVVDVICGGFPCQDVSVAGNRLGLEGSRSGLWAEYSRIIGELRPRYVLRGERPRACISLRRRERYLGDLAVALGYLMPEWHLHTEAFSRWCTLTRRDRVWIIRQPSEVGSEGRRIERPRQAKLKHYLRRKPYGGVTTRTPTFVEALMGFPIGHTDLGRSATPLSRKSRKSSAAR